MDDDLRKRHAEALARWAQMYPIPAWGLARDDAAENLAQRWGEVASTFTLAVRDEEMVALRERAEKAEAALATPEAAVYNLVWTAARNEVTRSWLASQGLVVMTREAHADELAELRRLRGEADLRAEKAEAKLAALDALHPHTELNWWHPCKNHSITDEEPTLKACPNCLIEPVMGCPRCGDDDCEIRAILHPDSPKGATS